MTQVSTIECQFPVKEPGQRRAYDSLITLLERKRFARTNVPGSRPAVELNASSDSLVSWHFGEATEITFSELNHSQPATNRLMELVEILERFHGHILNVDHFGINLTAADIPTIGANLLRSLARLTNLYQYPGDEPWYFVLPSTVDEHVGEIDDFSKLRLPKFEVVLDGQCSNRIVQIDVITDLSRNEIEARLPAPLGFGLPGLDQFFRSVFVKHPWSGFDIRFDFRYASALLNEWSTGEWLVKEGKRYNN